MKGYAQILEPKEITDYKFVGSSIGEPAQNEVAWASGEETQIGDVRIRSSTHKTYRDTKGGVSHTPPEDDPTRWLELGTTNKWAWTDYYESTITSGPSPVTITVRPGTFTSIVFRELNTGSVRIQCWTEPGGDLYYDQLWSTDDYLTGDLMWEFYFGEPRQRTYLQIEDLPVHPLAEVTITLNSYGSQATSSVGLIAFGMWERIGIPEYEFDADLISRSQIEEEPITGRVRIKRGIPSSNISGSCVLDNVDATRVYELLKRYIDIPVAVAISRDPHYDHLNTFGLINATVSTNGPTQSKLRLRIRGLT